MSRQARGRTAHHAGAAAEAIAERHYADQGATVLARRWRAPRALGSGEIDLVLRLGTMLVFVEVKERRRAGSDSPVSAAQWRRLEQAAEAYMMNEAATTGVITGVRFDLALIGPDGRPEITENARDM